MKSLALEQVMQCPSRGRLLPPRTARAAKPFLVAAIAVIDTGLVRTGNFVQVLSMILPDDSCHTVMSRV